MKKTMTIMTVILFVLTMAYPSFAQRGRGWGGSERQGGEQSRGMQEGGQVADPTAVPDFQIIDLNLSTDQISKINVLREAFLRDIKPLQEEMFGKRKDMKLLWPEKNQHEEKIAVIRKEMKNLKDQMQDKIAGYVLEVRRILTPDQDSLLRSFWPGMGGGRDRKMGSDTGYDGPGDGPGGSGGGRGPRGNW